MKKHAKVALVTGGNRGIGYELVRQLAMDGFKVILTSRNSESGHKAVQKLKDSHLDVSFLTMDINNQTSIGEAAAKVSEQYGTLDVLINNAGIYLDKNQKLVDMDPSVLEKTLETNSFGAYHVIRSFMPLMEQQAYGRIINVSSEYGAMSEMSSSGVGAYKLSKLILNGLTQLIAAESTKDIKTNAVDPGWVSSDMGGPSAPRTPQQAARSILWLATIGPEGSSGGFFKDGKQIDW
ncbi:SDR family NAD(P)-dependent oxidoreductase [Priestia aryabhattai]|uniref:SDR family NAD(P)-dependent oxidoreductase n=1 Tax=Priestia aryabhattai TaxID=412384 RepID=UPI0008DCDA97|nr:SDR family NAD(P)-dependent oxidoreductase [Priestia aryabhattai]MBZ6486323.1 SDR family NAD(P)-dependent oxidoreductase [Priestia aryabhattai]MDH3113311.1 SDR family NAD(P)-dependent oxidoreductase [Priestia aryabhattai]MDH3127784.1 SDR family NAD(P)-dependent oxidoreductase [Priestia aryabhattai]MDH3131978.1 SDR family NAD(P)-dependent oxidoreductase [Priestia aryabhattai]MED4152492.1 SDR family NAD(P)-dependent oxidoreductase [Priestia aryabhattai]